MAESESVKIDARIMQKIRKIAKDEGRSLSGTMRIALTAWIEGRNVHPTAQK